MCFSHQKTASVTIKKPAKQQVDFNRSQELSLGGALSNKYAGKGFFISLVKNPFLSSTKPYWLGGCECPLAPPWLRFW
jgi:hypothetical protein